MKVLAFCPLNPNPPRLWGRTVTSIFRLDWQEPIDWLFRANDNPDRGYGPIVDKHRNITRNYNYARRAFLASDYDALLCIECDMIVPPDALKRLVACDADVAYGLYIFRSSGREWNAYTILQDNWGRSLSTDTEAVKAAWGNVIDVAGVGLGCTLIRRRVLEATEFTLPAHQKMSCDWMLALFCQEHGFTQRCDTGLVCGHQTYKPFPQIFWPDPMMRRFYRQEILDGVQFKPLMAGPGEKIEIPVGMGRTELYTMPEASADG